MEYTYRDIRDAYTALGIEKGATVLLKTDIRWLGRFEDQNRNRLLEAHYQALADAVDVRHGSIAVSTASTYLCNTDTPFDKDETPSERGMLTEYIRTRAGAVRSFHPFMSYAAVGKNADTICRDVSRHAFGPETPKDRLLALDAQYVSLGSHPRFTCTVVHHIEFLMGVPYRYVKEFIHPVVRRGQICYEPFYLYVLYKECAVKRNKNVKIFKRFFDEGYTLRECSLGRGKVYAYSMHDFFKSTILAFKDDIYVWTDEPPTVRAYRQ